MRRTLRALVPFVLIVSLCAPALAAGPAAKVTDLAWMTGHWEGNTGNGTLEENWAVPKAGSMASLVRATNGDATGMIELIVIEEEEGSLVLRLQQWNPGFAPRSPEPQVMKLKELSERKVLFEATSEGGMKSLGYSRPEDDKFVISVETAQGQFDIPLMAVSPH
jgi:hypothetical protein